MEAKDEYIVKCWYCGAEYDAVEAGRCQHVHSTKMCPFCLHCLCGAPEAYKAEFRKNYPREVMDDMSTQRGGENPKLGEMLVRSGKITREQLREAISRQPILKKKLGEILVMMGLLTPEELELYLVDQKWIDEIDLKSAGLDFRLVEKFGVDFCLQYRMIPIEYYHIGSDRIFRFAIGSKEDLFRVKECGRLRSLVLIPYLAAPGQVEDSLSKIQRYRDENIFFVLDDDDGDREL